MENWLYENWLGAITLIGVLIGGAGAVWSAIVAHRALKLAQRSAARPLPIIHGQAREMGSDRDGWLEFEFTFLNRSDTPFELLGITAEKPKDLKICSHSAWMEPDGFGNYPAPGSFPASKLMDIAQRKILDSVQVAPQGTRATRHENGDRASTKIFGHSHYSPENDLRIRLKLRWMDHAAQTFTIAVKVTTPNIRTSIESI